MKSVHSRASHNGRIPVFVLDEHHQAFFAWQVAKIRGIIDRPLDLFHVDAHDDMDRPHHFSKSIHFPGILEAMDARTAYFRDFSRNELTISNFIVPAVLAGIVGNIYFIPPAWKNYKPRRKSKSICSVFGEGIHLKYDIHPGNARPEQIRNIFPDWSPYTYFIRPLPSIPAKRRVLLDIDLDYFACRESILNHMGYEMEITKEQYETSASILNDPTLPYSRLSFEFVNAAGKYLARIGFQKYPEVAHLPSNEEIRREIRTLMDSLVAKNIRPSVITLCRSRHSGYCPGKYGEFIEKELLEALDSTFRARVVDLD